MSIPAKYRPHYTYGDYCQWEGKWELIEGMPYAMNQPLEPYYQNINGNLYLNFHKELTKSCKKYKLYPGIDWKISEDTVVQPDFLIVEGKIEGNFLDFQPALVSEVLYPSTASKDRGEKMELYLSQKVKYHLIVDPQFKKVEVYELISNQYQPVAYNPGTYIFSLEEGCSAEVDFTDIWE
jgi:Uma2 family endonuclease